MNTLFAATFGGRPVTLRKSAYSIGSTAAVMTCWVPFAMSASDGLVPRPSWVVLRFGSRGRLRCSCLGAV